MNSVVISVNGQPLHFVGPSAWEEVKAPQYLQFLRSLKVEGGEFALLQLWFGMRYRHMRWLDEEQRLALLALIDFTRERPNVWMVPRVRIGWRFYYGPGHRLEHLTFGEFMAAEAARTAENRALLAAALYSDQTKRTFNPARIGSLERRMSREDETLLESVLVNYLGCLDYLASRFRHVFRPGDGSGGGGTWLDIGLNLARQTSALGSFQQLEQTNLYLALPVLESLLKEQDELEKRMKRND
ncbi:hypothetical protein F5984_20515 [Rudanella paleaurantiibacter]|uniref:Uncharacterized protein n=1 Tax=Rudanella paleaurantiibacter TaxID=2614655 RepID=A0A7J5TVF5_9BACT|nr:hypothetical protein [Rudanella paleaurantiibacter]KAB7728132.1 hypothetical protein F5984_20515 [Rudanella paleaurantiibacter]